MVKILKRVQQTGAGGNSHLGEKIGGHGIDEKTGGERRGVKARRHLIRRW